MVAASLLSILLALAVAAKPVERDASPSLVKLPFAKRVSTGTTNIVSQDVLRLKNIKGGKNQGLSAPAENKAIEYVASVGVGNPPTYCK